MNQDKNNKSQPYGNNLWANNKQGGYPGSMNNRATGSAAPENTSGSGDSRQAPISLPTGGGAIRGIGEKFQANPATGTASFTVLLTISEGRGGFTPQLALSYDSGSGNSAFGLGWNIGLPSITRKTDKGLPQYGDHPDHETDTFILSGAEDLVPVMNGDMRAHRTEGNYDIYSYQPRTEGLFALIERWVDKTSRISHWRSISKENITSVYGLTATARIADPADSGRIFSWLIEESWDAKGNLIWFSYKKEDNAGIENSCFESHRLRNYPTLGGTGGGRFPNTYLKFVAYGNMEMIEPSNGRSNYEGDFHFYVVFDYGDHNPDNTQAYPNQTWTARPDAFSNYKAGFEIRTYRLCRRVLMFHKFPELGMPPVLVRSTDLNYKTTPSFSLLQSVTHCGYEGQNKDNFPPLEFGYTEAVPGISFKEVPRESYYNLPGGIDGQQREWADLYSEGVSGILNMRDDAWYFKPSHGDRQYLHPEGESIPSFGGLRSEIPKPNVVRNAQTTFRLNDIDGDGFPELVVQGQGLNGFFSRLPNGKWLNFRNFEQYPNINMGDANIRFMDLTGDGLADIVISKGEYFDIYLSEGKKGYGQFRRVHCGDSHGSAPRIVFSDYRQRIFLADMSGDGLTDIVQITHQGIVYWPNLGYGKFGEKVIMAHAPLLDSSDQFDARFVHLADVDGTGTADLLYIAKGRIRYYKNLSGNAWEEQELPAALSLYATQQTFIQTLDLLGNGTQCVVVTSSLPTQENTMRYWELTSGVKPFLLKEISNNMGGVTKLHYASSTKFYMQDKFGGKPWITKLPFPVQVLEKVETIDLVGDKHFTNRYAYHHGYFDPTEREFRGFGMVEQWDTENYELGITNEELVPPVYTKTWFHTGYPYYKDQYRKEYWNGDAHAWKLPATPKPGGLTGDETREAHRALRGSILRTEIYAQDGSDLETVPFTTKEKSYSLWCLQPKGKNKHAVFLKTNGENLLYHYERNAADPRILHKMVLETDVYGNETKTAEIAYPRRNPVFSEQGKIVATCTENDFINDANNGYRHIGILYQTKQYEIHNLPNNGAIVEPQSLAALQAASVIDYAATPAATGLQKRLIKHDRTLFWNAALTAALPLGQTAAQNLIYQKQSLELTQTVFNQFNSEGAKLTASILADGCKYLQEGTNWFAISEIERYDATKFYRPMSITDAFGNQTNIAYDHYHLFPTKITDALNFTTTAEYDYRVLHTKKMTDPNGNSQMIIFNTLGLVSKMVLQGKNAGEGDTPDNPTEIYGYDLHCWEEAQIPVFAYIAKRETHASAESRWLESYVYTDGLGNEIMTKTTAEDGLAWTRSPIAAGPVEAHSNDRWLASGKTIYNNKGQAVKQYEPWYSATFEFEDEEQLTHYGVTPVMHYDPLGRLIQTDFPDGTTGKVEFDGWQQKNFDQNDCDADSPHYNTPQAIDLDVLGRSFQTTDDNGTRGKYVTKHKLDITGRILASTDAKGRLMTQNRYALSEKHLLYTTNIDSGIRWMVADTTGNERYRWDSRTNCIRTEYDALLRPTDVLLKTGTAAEKLVQKTIYGTNAVTNSIGQIAEIQAQDGKAQFSYDFKGNILTLQKRFTTEFAAMPDWNNTILLGELFTTETACDALNRLVSVKHPDNSVVSYRYDKGGLLQKVLHGSTQHITNITYNPKGQRENIYYGNNTKTRYYYNPLNFRLTRLLTTRNTGEVALQDLNYSYDSVGNIVSIRDNAQQTVYFSNSVIAPVSTFEYDALYRLVKATGRELSSLTAPTNTDFANTLACPNTATNAMRNYTHNYSYDELGNMQSDGWKSFIYDTATNRLLRHTGTTNVYTYDAHGNMTKMPNVSSMGWDYKDQLISAANGSTFSSYFSYDAEGNRTRKVTVKGSVREERYYINGYELFRKYTGTSLTTERKTVNISDNEKVFVRMDSEAIRYQYDNHLGSACLELDEYGYIISYEEYHPFGTTSYRAGRSATEVSWKRYKYCGKERDEETGLYYYGARYYAAWLCRFVSVDPLQHKQPGKTPYHYCSNNPISRIDPRGMQDDEPHKKKTSGLSINPKDTYAREDIKSLANNKRNAKYISFAESGTVTLDFGGLAQDKIDKILGQDEGLALINSLNTTANTEGVIPSYFYGTEGATGIGLENPAKQKDIRDYYSNITTLDNKDIYQKPFGEADGFGGYFSKAFILNASTTPYTSDGSAYGLKPLDGFDSKVYIGRGTFASVEPVTRDNFDSVSGKTIRETKDELVPKSRSGIVKHELKEALYRTALGMPYDTAHHKAGEITTVDRFYLHK